MGLLDLLVIDAVDVCFSCLDCLFSSDHVRSALCRTGALARESQASLSPQFRPRRCPAYCEGLARCREVQERCDRLASNT